MKQWKVTAYVRVPNPVAQVWNGSSYQADTRQQLINTVVTANNYFEAKAMVEGQYGSNLSGVPVIIEA
jgi:hypothetical protein